MLFRSGTNTLTAVFTPADTTNYFNVTNTVSLVVNPAALTITANSRTNECGQTLVLNGTNFTASGLAGTDSVTSVTLTNVGSSVLVSSAVGSGLANDSITYVAGVLTTVDTTPPVITVLGSNPLTNTYNNPFVDPGATALDACVGSVPVITNSPVGTYAIMPALVDASSRLANYNVTTNNGTLTVLAATPVVVWTNPASIIYGVCWGQAS